MNKYLTHLNKIEFVVTNACTGKCKHCSQGEHSFGGAHLDAAVGAGAIKKIAAEYNIKTVMTFGGEPLLYPDVVCAILSAAKELQIPHRQVITNGYFTKDFQAMHAVVESLAASGVNDLLLSVDAFHQETIPVDVVHHFASLAKTCGIPTRLQPAWLISSNDDNAYNQKTNQILQSFADLSIFQNEGNVIFPEGNALKYLSQYFTNTFPENPYIEDPYDIRCVSFDANGDVLDGNVYQKDILEILNNYTP